MVDAAWNLWISALSRAKVKMNSEDRAQVYYTALFHAMLFPSLLSEDDGSYRLQRVEANSNLMVDLMESVMVSTIGDFLEHRRAPAGHKMYGTFSSWDTYRGLHHLIGMLFPDVSKDFALSLIEFASAWGYIPPWQLYHSPTDMMEGDGGSIILATLALQGLVDKELAFRAVNKNRRSAWHADETASWGNYVLDSTDHSFAKVLEQAKADKCTSRLAADLGHDDEANFFNDRAALVSNYWDAAQLVVAPITQVKDGKVMHQNLSSFFDVTSKGFTEGTPRQYSFGLDFDVERLTRLHGGRDAMLKHLDYFFNEAPEPEGDPDMTGNLHGLSIGNEPTMHTPYLYSLLGEPRKTQDIVDIIIKRMFHNGPKGLPGNDDLGAMSAWVALSMLGFYLVDACSGEFVLGRPFVDYAELSVGAAKLLRVDVLGQSANGRVWKAVWNG